MSDATEAAIRAQRDYYDKRAPSYDERDADATAKWRVQMADVFAAFDRVYLDGDILELAAGTGGWTERLVDRARSLTVIDGSVAMLDANRDRLGPAAANVDYRVADLFAWQPERTWDACVFGFWLCKVPDDRIATFLRSVAAALEPGGLVCCVDKTADSEPPSELEERTLGDGRRFTIIDHPRPPARVVEVFAAAGLEVTIETFGGRVCLAHGTKR